MDKSQQLDAFYKIFMELLNDLSIIKPNDSSLMWVKAAVNLITKQMLAEQFMEYVDIYSDKILKKDETFFLDELHKEVDKESFAGQEIAKVRSIWQDPKTTDDTKNCIWNYFIILVTLGKKITKK